MDKLCLLPPLVLLCSDLLLRSVSANISALPLHVPTTDIQSGSVSAKNRPSIVIFHPPNNSCVLRMSQADPPLKLGPCSQADRWARTPQKFLIVKGTYFCLKAAGSGKPATLGILCSESDSSWDIKSENGETRISTKLADGAAVCLDVGAGGTLVTNPCLCSGGGTACDLDSQWFEIATRDEAELAQFSPREDAGKGYISPP